MIQAFVAAGKIMIGHREGDRLGVRIRTGQTYMVTLYEGQKLVRTICNKTLSEAVTIVKRFVRKEQDYGTK